jgi:formylglycine-generating enzyme required for sulfatase activity
MSSGKIIIVILLAAGNIFAQKNHLKAPKGFQFVNDTLIMGETEVSYDNWINFMYHELNLGESDSASFKASRPDSNKRNKEVFYSIIYSREFDRAKIKYDGEEYNYPVTGISKKQAEAYCDYLSEIEKERSGKISGNEVNYKFVYRLPSPQEFVKIHEGAYKTDEQKLASTTGRNKTGCALINFKTLPTCKSDSVGITKMKEGVVPVWSYWPNEKGLYCVQGNVAEMTSEEGIAIGGSYLNPIEECQISSTQKYKKPEIWLGFRVAADLVIVKEK